MLAGPAIGGAPAGAPFFILQVVRYPMAKPFLTYDQQIQLLRRKKLVIEDETTARETLHRYGYFSLVSGYKDLLKNPTTKNYQDGVTFQDLVAVYQFDEALRGLTFRYLLQIERHMRSALSYTFCDKFGDGQTAYITAQNYDISIPTKQHGVSKLIEKHIQPLLDYHSSYPYIEHHKQKYQNVPLWVLINTFTFGTLSKFYEFSQSQIQSAVSKEFDAINESQLRQILKVLTDFRNICAHSERLFTHRCAKYDIPDLPLHKKLMIPKNGREYINGKRDYFAVVLIFRYLLPHSEFLRYKKDLAKLMDSLCEETQKIAASDLLQMMGMPINWKKITRYQKA